MRFPWLLAGLALLVAPALAGAGNPPKIKINDKDAGKTYHIPYRLTDSGHILVRVKINGKGPFNFIVDTGAPLVYVSVPVAKKLGIVAEKKGFNTLDKLELEGGAVLAPVKCVVETPYQLEGMNAMGLAGVELHGILGYTVLAHYKMELDPTRDKMTWTRLDFVPPAPQSAGLKEKPAGIDAMEKLGKLLALRAKLLGITGAPEPGLRGFIGMELSDKGNTVVIQSVLAKSPAAEAGLHSGDVLTRVQRIPIGSRADLMKLLAKTPAGQPLRFTVQQGGAMKTITVTPAEGL
jgi:hypothetical protein